MVRLKKDKWDYFVKVHEQYGFKYFPQMENLRSEMYLNERQNIVIIVYTREVKEWCPNRYNGNFEVIIEMNNNGLLEVINRSDIDELRLIDRIEGNI